MKSNTTIALVLVVLIAVGYYFWKKKKDANKENEVSNDKKPLGIGTAPALPVGTRPLKSTEMPSKITLVEEPKLGGLRAPVDAQFQEPKAPIAVTGRGGDTRVILNPNGGMVNVSVNPNQFPTSIVNPTRQPSIPGTRVGSITLANGLGNTRFINPFQQQNNFSQSIANALANLNQGGTIVSNSMVASGRGKG
jgi:hypothetical protein